MRKSFHLSLLAAMALVAALAIVGCGDSDNNDDGTGGTGGSAGAGGTGGTGGNKEPAPTCDEVCDHVTDDCNLRFPDADPDDPKAKCMDICENWERQPRILSCMLGVQCVAGQDSAAKVNACQTYAPCDTACNHLDQCGIELPDENGQPVDLAECKRLCPFQDWSDEAIECLGTAECSVEAVNSCFSL